MTVISGSEEGLTRPSQMSCTEVELNKCVE